MVRCRRRRSFWRLDRLREFSGAPFDPAAVRGTLSAQVQLGLPLRPDLPPGSTDYDITVDLSNFSADKMVFGQKAEAQALRVTANNQSTRSRATCALPARRAMSNIESSRASPTPRCGCRRRSTRRRGAARHRSRQHGDRRAADAAHRARRPGRAGRALQRRSRSHGDPDRQPAAGLGEAVGQAGAARLHDVAQQRRDALRRCLDRRAGRAREGLARARRQRRSAIHQPAGVRDVRRRQDQRQGRPRRRWRLARCRCAAMSFDGRNFIKMAMGGPARIQSQEPLSRSRSRREARRHRRPLRRDHPRPRLAHVAPRRPRPHLLAQRQDRPRHAADRRDAHPRRQRQAGALLRDQRRRRAVPLRRCLSAHGRRQDVGSAWIRRRRTPPRRMASSTCRASRSAAKARSTAWWPGNRTACRSTTTTSSSVRPAPISPACRAV